MKITNAILISHSSDIKEVEPEHVFVHFSSNDQIFGMRWKYSTKDNGLYGMVKRRGAVWDPVSRLWTFQNQEQAEAMIKAIRKRNPSWPLFTDDSNQSCLADTSFSYLNLPGDIAALMFPYPFPYCADVDGLLGEKQQCLKVSTKGGNAAILVVGPVECICAIINDLEQQGAKRNNNALAKRFELATGSKIQVKVSGWAVEIVCDLSNPLHYIIKPKQEFNWVNGWKAIPWNGVIHITRKGWDDWKKRILAAGLEWEGDNPETDLITPSFFDPSIIPGWNLPAANGYLLHDYQRRGAEFCSTRGMRALIGDEMGVGKTAQAIAAAEGISADRILVICPANARYVWESEINGWSSGGTIQHVLNQLDTLDHTSRWHIATYELLTSRTETWTIVDEIEEKEIRRARPDLGELIPEQKKYPKKIKLEDWNPATPQFSDEMQIAKWRRKMRRLRGELLEQILAAGPLLMIVDEAHRAKNSNAKRTRAIQRIAAGHECKVLLLTGTPVRNNEHEAAVLLSILDTDTAMILNKKNGYTIEDIKDYLNQFMIRRTKMEVLPELPEKTRQRIDIDQLEGVSLNEYYDNLLYARQLYSDAINQGESELQARQAMQGAIEKARTSLGMAKVLGGEVADLVADVVENKGCCIVFCAHHQVSDELHLQLKSMGLRSVVVDGRTEQKKRSTSVEDFQSNRLDVFIGGINAAGEAITLTRSDTVIFVELDWVPSALLQAEDRIHRVGQRANCQIIQLIARFPGDNLDDAMIGIIGSKLERIGYLLDESTENIIRGQGSLKNEIIDSLLGKSATSKAIAGQKASIGSGRY